MTTAHTVFGIIGTTFSIVIFLAPLPTFVTIVRKKEVGQFSPMPFLATLFSCMGGVLYGLPLVHPNSVLVLLTNAVGIIMEFIWIIIFYIFSTRRTRMIILRTLAVEILLVVAISAVVLCGARTHEKRTEIAGIICVVLNVFMYASPLSTMKRVIQTRSVKYMPVPISLASLVSTICWLVYSILRFDLYIMISNGLGAFLSGAQIIIYCFVRYCMTPRSDEPQPNC